MEAAVPALASIGTGEGDVLPGVRPGNLVTLHLHVGDKVLAGDGILQRLVDGLNQIQLPAVAAQTRLVLAGLHAPLFGTQLALVQHPKTVGQTNLIVHLAVRQKVAGALMELVSILVADAVHHHVVVQMTCVNMGGDHHLEAWELPLGELQTDGIDLLGRDVVLRGEGLDEVVELCAVCFVKALFGHLHLNEGGLGNAVAASDQPRVAPAGFLLLLHVVDHAAHRTGGLLFALDRGEGRHQRTS